MSAPCTEIEERNCARQPPSSGRAGGEHYEVWVLETAEWTLRSWWRAFELAWAVADAHLGPVRILRARYEQGEEVERQLVVELRVTPKLVAPDGVSSCQSSALSPSLTGL